jgi:hypothetical protein
MNAFLVVLVCEYDNLPLAIFDKKEVANEYAKGVEPSVGDIVCEILDITSSEPLFVSVFEFRDGGVFGRETIKEFE